MSRKQKKYHFIYKTTDTRNGDFYIGMHSTNNLNDGYVGSGNRIRNIKYKHGVEFFNVDILEFLPDRESLKKREEEIVNSGLLKEDKCMNLVIGGEGGFISIDGCKKGRQITDEILKNKYGENFRQIISTQYYYSLDENKMSIHIQKIKDGQKLINFDHNTRQGVKHSEKTKEKMSEKASERIGVKNSQFGTCWITNGIENKKIKKDDLDHFIINGWTKGCSRIGNVGKNQYSK